MPEISRFLGIVITMYFRDHSPPHFHVAYNEYKALVEIQTLNVLEGELPAKLRGLVEEWAEQHREELLQNWESMRTKKTFSKIKPLV
ncbi:MAG: DUF4160 domain-containing protein [Chitinispirillia bacterium]|nr:DUF4160 domain-containing protein [Chitinispirillia bacterium]MCL2241818.1 DUF4160 domain-containing protein [Chitinispirillia bacterium]